MNRRELVRAGIGVPVSLSVLTWVAGCGQEQTVVCANADELSAAEASLRQSMHYVAQSPDPERACRACSFFTASAAGDAGACGTCRLFDGGPVNAGGHCDSWSAA